MIDKLPPFSPFRSLVLFSFKPYILLSKVYETVRYFGEDDDSRTSKVVIIVTVAIIGILIVGSEFYIALPIPVTRVSEGFVGLVNLIL